MDRSHQGPHTPGEAAKPVTAAKRTGRSSATWCAGLTLGVALAAGYTENAVGQEPERTPTTPATAPDNIREEGTGTSLFVPRVDGSRERAAREFLNSAPDKSENAEQRAELIEIYSKLLNTEFALAERDLREKSNSEISRTIAGEFSQQAERVLAQRKLNLAEQEDILRKMDALSVVGKRLGVVREQLGLAGAPTEKPLPQLPMKELERTSEVDSGKDKDGWDFRTGGAILVVGLAIAFWKTIQAFGIRKTLGSLWGQFTSELSESTSNSGTNGSTGSELTMNEISRCPFIADRVPAQLTKLLTKFGLEPRVIVQGTVSTWNKWHISFAQMDNVAVGVTVNFNRLDDLQGLENALGKRYLEKHPEMRSLVSAIMGSAVERFLFEPLSEGSKKQRSEWKKHSKFFQAWAEKLGMQEAGFFGRFRSATTLPQDTFRQYLKTERARMNVLSSGTELDVHLEALNTSLEELTAILRSGSLDSKNKTLLGTLLKGVHQDCASTLDQAEEWSDPDDEFSWVARVRKRNEQRLNEIDTLMGQASNS